MNKPPTPELAFRLGAEAMRTHIAAWAVRKGLAPVAIDILNMAPPKFALPESMVIEVPNANYPHCTEKLRKKGLPYPRTCAECGLGPCKAGEPT